MDVLAVEFMMLKGGFRMEFGGATPSGAEVYSELLRCFYKAGEYKLWVTVTPEIKLDVKRFVSRHGKTHHYFHRLQKKIQDMPDGEIFLIAKDMPADSSAKSELEILLEVLNEFDEAEVGAEWKRRVESIKDFTGSLLDSYDLFTPRTDIRVTIGNAKKDDRVCRFCRGSLGTGSSFAKVAHAIPEALGNKSLILGDECDECNKYFGDSIEPHLIGQFDIYRAFLGVKGKSGVPNLKYTNGEITSHNGVPTVIAKKIEVTDDGIFVDLGGARKLTPAKLYRALCKITLSVIKADDMIGLEDTVAWVRNDRPQVRLPKVAINIVHGRPGDSNFSIAVFTRKTEDYTLPHVLTELRFGAFVYVFILPFSRKDKLGFLSDSEFEAFWSFFPMYSRVGGWRYQDLHSTQEITVSDSIRVTHSGRPEGTLGDNASTGQAQDQ